MMITSEDSMSISVKVTEMLLFKINLIVQGEITLKRVNTYITIPGFKNIYIRQGFSFVSLKVEETCHNIMSKLECNFDL